MTDSKEEDAPSTPFLRQSDVLVSVTEEHEILIPDFEKRIKVPLADYEKTRNEQLVYKGILRIYEANGIEHSIVGIAMYITERNRIKIRAWSEEADRFHACVKKATICKEVGGRVSAEFYYSQEKHPVTIDEVRIQGLKTNNNWQEYAGTLVVNLEVETRSERIPAIPVRSSTKSRYGPMYLQEPETGRTLIQDFEKEEATELADAHLVAVDGTRVPCSRYVLATRSEVFRAMFAHADLAEAKTGEVKVGDFTEEQVRLFWKLLVTDALPKEMTLEGATGLYDLGDKYLIHSVKWLAKRWVAGHMDEAKAVAILQAAVTEEPGPLEEMALAHLAENRGSGTTAVELAQLGLPKQYLFKMIELLD